MSKSEALEVLRQVKAKLGRCYKQAIRNAWTDGDYHREYLDEWSGKLQSIRNTFGPSWLINARP